ncbi:TPA: hypothetical protein DEP21_05275 [Patescibacteria group bacterium]|nr:hypothetical protein [Candidatus Gracilibacteria bacterium]
MSLGLSYGKKMTFEEHVESYPNKEELQQYKRLFEISNIMYSGQTDLAEKLLEEEFESIDNAIALLEELKKKIFSGWKPLV